MTDLAGISLADWSSGAILAVVVVFILLGRLVPKATLDRVEKERDHWRSVAEEAIRQNSKLIDAARPSVSIAEYVQQLAQGGE